MTLVEMRVIGAARRLVEAMKRAPRSIEAAVLRDAVHELNSIGHGTSEHELATAAFGWAVANARAAYWRGVAEAQLIGPMSKKADKYWDEVRLAREELMRLGADA